VFVDRDGEGCHQDRTEKIRAFLIFVPSVWCGMASVVNNYKCDNTNIVFALIVKISGIGG
jgi:hypothetical protein